MSTDFDPVAYHERFNKQDTYLAVDEDLETATLFTSLPVWLNNGMWNHAEADKNTNDMITIEDLSLIKKLTNNTPMQQLKEEPYVIECSKLTFTDVYDLVWNKLDRKKDGNK